MKGQVIIIRWGMALLLCLVGVGLLQTVGQGQEPTLQSTILFTHDLHSHFLPQSTEEGGESGGYARLATALKEERERYPNALTLDGGDFSVGSLIQTLYTTKAPELRTMGAMGYDAVTAGNHEFDHTGPGFAKMLTSARKSKDPVPPLVMSNFRPSEDNPEGLDIQRAMSSYGVRETLILERGGVTYGIFGLMGEDADRSAPNSGFTMEDPVKAAARSVRSLKEQGAEFIICLSHSGTDPKKSRSEDERLAKEVDGIDVILSGHTHTVLEEPIVVNDTYIVSSGSYCRYLGSITLEWTRGGEKKLKDYRLIPIDERIPEDPAIAQMVEGWKQQVGGSYLASYGLSYDEVLTHTTFSLLQPNHYGLAPNTLGELVADSFRWAVQQAEGEEFVPVSFAITAEGSIRAPLLEGKLTTAQAFDVLSLGVGPDGTSGFPLVSCYLTGEELMALLEVDASISPYMPAVQLYGSGIAYRINPNRILLNRVSDAKLVTSEGNYLPLEKDRLYRVVGGLYAAQMLGAVREKSYGLLSLEPKDQSGVPIEDFTEHIIYQEHGGELKEWYALASYLQSFGRNGIPETYLQPDGRKVVQASWNPVELLRNPNRIALTLWIGLAVVIGLVWLVVYRISLWRQRKSGGYRRRRLL